MESRSILYFLLNKAPYLLIQSVPLKQQQISKGGFSGVSFIQEIL